MKKLLIFIMIVLAMFLVGCQSVINQNSISTQNNSDIDNNTPDAKITSNSTSNDISSAKDPLPSRSIELRGTGKLNEMREMLACGDETRLEQYVQSIADSGIQSKDDLVAFVKMIDSLPSIQVLDGDITWICFSHSISEDTGKETNVVYITTEAANGDWTRVEYVLSVTDVSGKISDEKASIGENPVLNSSIKSSDGNLTIYIEMRNPHQSGSGTMIQWTGDACGIFTRIYYFTNSADDIKAEDLFENMKINYKSK